MTSTPTIPFGDLRRQYNAHRAIYDGAISRVLSSGRFVLGREVEAFEAEFAGYCGAPHCVGCGSGTEAIHLAIAAHGIGTGDAVITVANTCVPTVAGIVASGASIVLCDADDATALMCPDALAEALNQSRAKAVVPVHLYGNPASVDAINAAAAESGAIVIEDAAQAHCAEYKARRIGSHGNTACWSFYPSKNLGAFGDAGAVTTHSTEIASRLRMLRNYGQERRYHHSIPGVNSRLDEIQAAILRAKLPLLGGWNVRRRDIARRYRSEIRNSAVQFIDDLPDSQSCHHLFPVRCAHRDELQTKLAERGIECFIHYPIPIHLQKAYAALGHARGDFPAAEKLCDQVLSLPLYPELTDDEVDRIIKSVTEFNA